MKVSYEFFKEYPTTRVLIQKIMSAKYPTVATSYRVKKLVDLLSKEFEIFGQLLKEKEGIIEWGDEGVLNNEEVQKAFKEFYAHEFDLDFKPLDSSELSHIEDITPREIELLEMISTPNAFDSLLV